jgi:hypothetical protein
MPLQPPPTTMPMQQPPSNHADTTPSPPTSPCPHNYAVTPPSLPPIFIFILVVVKLGGTTTIIGHRDTSKRRGVYTS